MLGWDAKGCLVWGRRGGYLGDTETEGQRAEIKKNDRDIGGKGIQAAKEKQKGEKEEGNVERGEKKYHPSPFSGRKGRGGNKSLTVFFPPLFWFWRGICREEVGCFSNLPCLSAIRTPSLPPHTPRNLFGVRVGNLGNGGRRAWGPLRQSWERIIRRNQLPFQHIFTPHARVSV